MTRPFENHLEGLAALAADLRSNWRDDAACKNTDPGVFFDDDENRAIQLANRRTARRICSTCPVVAHCARFGADQEAGRWAGYRPNTLRDMRSGEKPGWTDLMDGRLPQRKNGVPE